MPWFKGKRSRRNTGRLQRQQMTERAQQEEYDNQIELEEDGSGFELSDDPQATSASPGYVKTIATIFQLAKKQEIALAASQSKLRQSLVHAGEMLQECLGDLKHCETHVQDWSSRLSSVDDDYNTSTFLAENKAVEYLTTCAICSTQAASACKGLIEPATQLEHDGKGSMDVTNVWFTQYFGSINKLKDMFNDLSGMMTSCLNYVEDSKFNDDFISTMRNLLDDLANKGGSASTMATTLTAALATVHSSLKELEALVAAQLDSLSSAPKSHFESIDAANHERMLLDKEYFLELLKRNRMLDLTLLDGFQAYEANTFAVLVIAGELLTTSENEISMLVQLHQSVSAALELGEQLPNIKDVARSLAHLKQSLPENLVDQCRLIEDISKSIEHVILEVHGSKAELLTAHDELPYTEQLLAVRSLLIEECKNAFIGLDSYQSTRNEFVNCVSNCAVDLVKILDFLHINSSSSSMDTSPSSTMGLTTPSPKEDTVKIATSFVGVLGELDHLFGFLKSILEHDANTSRTLNTYMEQLLDLCFTLVDTALAHGAKDPRTVSLVRHPSKQLGLKLQTSTGTRGVRIIGTAINSQARDANNLFPGDAIIKINDVDVTQYMHDDIIRLISEQEGNITFELARDFPNEPRQLTLKRSPNLGFGIEMTIERNYPKIVQVVPQSPAFETQQVRETQFLLKVEDESTENMSLARLNDILSELTEVNICVGPHPSQDSNEQTNVSFPVLFLLSTAYSNSDEKEQLTTPEDVLQSILIPPPAEEKDCTQITPAAGVAKYSTQTLVLKRSNGPLGLRLKSLENLPGVYVAGFVPGSQAAECEGVEIGDQIVSVNGRDVSDLSHENIVNIIRGSQDDEIKLTLRHIWDDKEQLSNHVTATESSMNPDAAKVTQITDTSFHSPTKARSVVIQRDGNESLGMHLIAPPEGYGAAVLRLVSGSPAANAGVFAGEFLVSINGHPTRDLPHKDVVDVIRSTSGDVTVELEDPPVPEAGVSRTVIIQRKEAEPLGLQLQSFDNGALINKILPDGAASRVKSLFSNDVITAVGGVPVSGMTPDEVGKLILKSGSDVHLSVQQKQEEHSSQTETESSRSSPSTFILDVTDNERQRFPTATDIRKVTLHRSTPDKVFGLQLSIRKDVTVIKDVLPGGLAEESGCLYANDIILAINNHPVGCANDSEILKLLQQPGDVTILVAKSLNKINFDNGQGVVQEPEPLATESNVSIPPQRVVHVEKEPDKRLGLVLLPFTDDHVGAQVYGMLPDGTAVGQGFECGDRIVTINGKDVANASHEKIVAEFAHGKTFEVGIVPGDTLEAELRRSTTSQSFGLVLSCITEKTGVVVRNVLPNSPAANSTDQLQPNDLVVMINDSMVGHKSKDTILHEISTLLDLRIRIVRSPLTVPHHSRQPYENVNTFGTTTSDASSEHIEQISNNKSAEYLEPSCRRVYTITFKHSDQTGIGMGVRAAADTLGAIVDTVIPGSQAERLGVVPGDRILEINDTDVATEQHEAILRLLSSMADIALKIDSNKKRDSSHATITIHKRPGQPFGIRLRTENGHTYVHEVLPDSVACNSAVQVNDDIIRVNDNAVLGLSSEEVAKLFAAYDPVILEVEAISPKSPQPLQERKGSLLQDYDYQAPNLRKIKLQKSSESHFGIKLGMGPQGEGIVVSSIDDNSVAKEDGRVAVGDVVLAINGESMMFAVPHDTHAAVQRGGNELELVVASGLPTFLTKEFHLQRASVEDTWGLTIQKIPSKPGVYVTDVYPEHPAAIAGLQPGDCLITIQGCDVTSARLADAKAMFTNETTVTVTARRPALIPVDKKDSTLTSANCMDDIASPLGPGETTFTHLPISEAASIKAPRILRHVILKRQPDLPFGIRMSTDDDGTRIKSIDPKGAGAKSNLIHEGDFVVSVNEVDIISASISEISDVLSQSSRVSLVLADRVVLHGRAVSHHSGVPVNPLLGKYELRAFRLRKSARQIGIVLETRKFDNLTIVKDIEEDSFAAEAGLHLGDILVAVNGICVEKTVHTELLSAMTTSSELVIVVARGVTRTVELASGRTVDCGINLAISPSASGIVITSIVAESPAAACGVLFPSDLVLSINDKDVFNLSLQECNDLMKQHDPVVLVIKPFGGVLNTKPRTDDPNISNLNLLEAPVTVCDADADDLGNVAAQDGGIGEVPVTCDYGGVDDDKVLASASEGDSDVIDDDSFVVLGNSLTEAQMRALADDNEKICDNDTASPFFLTPVGGVVPVFGSERTKISRERDIVIKQMASLQEELEQLRLQLTTNSDSFTARTTQLQEQLASSEQTIKEKNAEIERLIKDQQKANNQVAEIQSKLESLSTPSEPNTMEERNTKGTRSSITNNTTYEDAMSKIHDLEDKLEDATTLADNECLARYKLELELAEVRKELTETKDKLDDALFKSMTSDENILKEDAEQANNQSAVASEQVSQLQQELSDAKSTADKVSTLEEEVDRLQKKISEQGALIEEKNSIITSLQHQINTDTKQDETNQEDIAFSSWKRSHGSQLQRVASPHHFQYRPQSDDPVDKAVARIVNDLRINPSHVERIQPKQYRLFGDTKNVTVRTVGNVVMARVGGGWQNMREYLKEHGK